MAQRIFGAIRGAGRPWRRALGKWLMRGAAGLALLVLAGGTVGYLALRTSLPELAGEVRLPGLSAPVSIVRTRHGIPFIRAATERDAMFALGFVHAQDRLFQMEFTRLLGQGRLSEVVGAATFRLDRTIRTLGIPRLARAALGRLSPPARRAVESYARGVNAFLEHRSGLLPAEFQLLRHSPAPWRPEDSLLWGRIMALRLSGNWHTEAFRAALSSRLKPTEVAQLWPEPAAGIAAPPTVGRQARAATDTTFAALLDAFPDELGPLVASNSWGLAGRRTTTGKPILANDPHLGFRAPGLWYLARIRAPGLDLAGATVPGVPFMILGHNGSVAWALTTNRSDTQDLFVEAVNPEDGGQYRTPEGWRAFETRQETIAVRGEPAREITVRRTRHGPVISDVDTGLADGSKAVALAATALRQDDDTADAFYSFAKARNADEFRSALGRFHSPVQNVTFADTAGTVGFVVAGRVPIRRAGTGFAPAPGADGAHDWTGVIPFAELPQVRNPPGGIVVSANHRAAPQGYRHFLGGTPVAPYRARRIHQMLDGGGPAHDLDRSTQIQLDSLSLMARDLAPLLVRHAGSDGRLRRIAARVAAWSGRMERNLPEPLIFIAWLRELNRRIFADDIGPLFGRFWALRPVLVHRVLTRHTEWCDDRETAARETCPDQIAASLATAVAELSDRYGRDPDGWRWGTAHTARFPHPIFDRIPLIRDVAGIAIPSDGGPFTVNRAQPYIAGKRHPYASVHGPGLRAVYDLANLDRSRFMIAMGQSGNPLSPRYGNFLRDWRDGKYILLPGTPDAKKVVGTLRLLPP